MGTLAVFSEQQHNYPTLARERGKSHVAIGAPRLVKPGTAGEFRNVRHDIARNQQHLRRENLVRSIIPFFMFELSKIRQFGIERHVISADLWGFKLRMSADAETFVNVDLKRATLPKLKETLKVILQEGWRYLSKLDYNTLVLLSHFCDTLAGLPATLGDRKSLRESESFSRAETLFLVFQADPGLVSRSVDAMRRAIFEISRTNSEAFAGPSLIERLFSKSSHEPSFYNIVLAKNMMSCRRFLQMSELLNDIGARQLMQGDSFDCSPAVQQEIERFVGVQVQSLGPLLQELSDIALLRKYLMSLTQVQNPSQAAGEENDNSEQKGEGRANPSNFDFALLVLTYEGDDRFSENRYVKDHDNLILFCARLIEVYLASFGRLISRGMRTVDNERIELFADHVFDSELSRLQYAHMRIAKIMPIMPTFSRERFDELRFGVAEPSEAETEVMNVFVSVADTLGHLGMEMIETINSKDDAPADDEALTLQPAGALTRDLNKPYPLKHETKVLEERGILRRKSVAQALELFTRCSLQAALWLGDAKLDAKFHREPLLRDKIHRVFATIERVASKEEYEALRSEKRFSIADDETVNKGPNRED